MILQNPYRLLGVFANDPLRVRIANTAKIRTFSKIGKEISFETDADGLLGKLQRTSESVEQANVLLFDNTRKAKFALFWFHKNNTIDDTTISHINLNTYLRFIIPDSDNNIYSDYINNAVLFLIGENFELAAKNYCKFIEYGSFLSSYKERIGLTQKEVDNKAVVRILILSLLEAYPEIEWWSIDLDIISRMNSVRAKDADNDVYRAEINDSRRKLQELDNSQLAQQLDEAESEFNAADNRDKKDQALESLKDILSKIDSEYTLGDWQRMENKLRGMYRELVEDNQKYGNEKTTAVIQQLKNDLERVAEAKDMEAAEELYDAMWNLDYKLAEVEFYIAWIIRWNRNFGQKKWSNPTRARSLVNQGMQIINSGNPTAEELRPIAFELSDMLPRSEKPQNDGILRQKN